MLQLSRWKVTLVVLALLFSVLFALPNVLPQSVRNSMPGFLPSRTVNLGLDLRGGSYLLMEVDTAAMQRELVSGEGRGDDACHGQHLDSGERLRQIHVVSESARAALALSCAKPNHACELSGIVLDVAHPLSSITLGGLRAAVNASRSRRIAANS